MRVVVQRVKQASVSVDGDVGGRIGGEILAVSQFTLHASTRKGNRPSWGRAARGEILQPLFEDSVDRLSRALGRPVPTGVCGAEMAVSLVSDGPVTIAIDSENPERVGGGSHERMGSRPASIRSALPPMVPACLPAARTTWR